MSVALAQFQLSTFRFYLSLIHLHHQRRGGLPVRVRTQTGDAACLPRALRLSLKPEPKGACLAMLPIIILILILIVIVIRSPPAD